MNPAKIPVLEALDRLLRTAPTGMTVLVSVWTVTVQVVMIARRFVLAVEVHPAVALAVQANVAVVAPAATTARERPWLISIKKWMTTLQIRRVGRAVVVAQ